jgi:endoglucanase
MSLLIALAFSFQTGCRAEQPWPLWEAYSQRFIDPRGRVIDRSAGDRTTSEGQAYAMFFALVANDRARFEKLLTWTESNLAGGDMSLRLPAWEWGRNAQGEWKTLDENPASDADLWMAYSLMEAGRLWHDERYAKLGLVMAKRIGRQEVGLVTGVGPTIIPGPVGFHPDEKTWLLNPSYLPLPVLTYMARYQQPGPWSGVIQSLPALFGPGRGDGYAMDWVAVSPEGVKPAVAPAQPTAGTKDPRAVGSYDAIRVYLWLGIADPATPGVQGLIGQLSGMSGYMKSAAVPPVEVDGAGKVAGEDSPPGFSAAVAPFLQAAGMKAQATGQWERLSATKDASSGLYGRTAAYYDQNLALFSTGFLERRYRFERDGRLKLNWK